MNSREIPIRTNPDHRPLKRHHTVRYYAHRVQESLTSRVCKMVCTIFLGLLLILIIIAFLLWISLRPHRPRFHIHTFTIPALTREDNFRNAEFNFSILIRNSNQNIGIHFDAMQVAVHYHDQLLGGASLLFPFYQEPKNTTELAGSLTGAMVSVNRERWKQIMADQTRGTVTFRLGIPSVIRFRLLGWNTTRHKMHTDCPVGVGRDGNILNTYKDKRCSVFFM